MNKNTEIFDENLNPVLALANQEELDVLVEIIKEKLSEALTISDAYKTYYPDHTKYSDLIAQEIRAFGGNSFVNLFRGAGPEYKEIVYDVAKEIKAPVNKHGKIESMEMAILSKLMEKAWQEMTASEREELAKEVGHANLTAGKGMSAVAFQAIFKAGGFKSYQLMVIIVNAVFKQVFGKGLSFAANAAMTRAASVLAGPIGLAITGLWTAIDIAGPSYKVTIPSVAYIAMLRYKMNMTECEGCGVVLSDTNINFCPTCGHKMQNAS